MPCEEKREKGERIYESVGVRGWSSSWWSSHLRFRKILIPFQRILLPTAVERSRKGEKRGKMRIEAKRKERDVSSSCFPVRSHRWRACNWSAQLRRNKTEMENVVRFDLVLTSALWNLCSWKQKKKKTNVNQWCTSFNRTTRFFFFILSLSIYTGRRINIYIYISCILTVCAMHSFFFFLMRVS